MDDYIVEQRVTALEIQQGTQTTDIRYLGEKIDGLKDLLEKIDHRLVGNGSLGITTRLDRLEQAEKNRSKLNWILVAAVAGLLVKAALSVLAPALSPKAANGATAKTVETAHSGQ